MRGFFGSLVIAYECTLGGLEGRSSKNLSLHIQPKVSIVIEVRSFDRWIIVEADVPIVLIS